MKWEEVKKLGSNHYKGQAVEQIDLFRSEGTLLDWAICEIRAHAARNLSKLDTLGTKKCLGDMAKIKHYAEMIICLAEERQEEMRGKYHEEA